MARPQKPRLAAEATVEELTRKAALYREILDYLEAIQERQQRLYSLEQLEELAQAARELSDAYQSVR